MTAPIQKLFALCKQTITKTSLDMLSKEMLAPIIASLNKITNNDICFNPVEFMEEECRKERRAPVSYMELYRGNDFTMAVFIVKEGSHLPLHDHPNMFGLLKLIHGSIKLVSFNDSEAHQHVISEADNSVEHFRPVSKNSDKIIAANEDCCVLTPVDGNVHEIHPLTEFSAFLDILTPPYGEVRPCHYWQEVQRNDPDEPNLRWLLQITEPHAYWCDNLPYKGPTLA